MIIKLDAVGLIYLSAKIFMIDHANALNKLILPILRSQDSVVDRGGFEDGTHSSQSAARLS